MNDLPNRITFDQLIDAKQEVIDSLAIEDVLMLCEDLNERSSTLSRDSALYANLLTLKFGGTAQNGYIAAEKDSGKIVISIAPKWELVCQRSKTVKWDQTKLAALYSRIEQAGDDPAVYIKRDVATSYKVPEATYKNWPENVQKAFLDARTVESGDTQFSLQRKKDTK